MVPIPSWGAAPDDCVVAGSFADSIPHTPTFLSSPRISHGQEVYRSKCNGKKYAAKEVGYLR